MMIFTQLLNQTESTTEVYYCLF